MIDILWTTTSNYPVQFGQPEVTETASNHSPVFLKSYPLVRNMQNNDYLILEQEIDMRIQNITVCRTVIIQYIVRFYKIVRDHWLNLTLKPPK